MIEAFITPNELEDLLDYERHEHPSDSLVRKLLKAIAQQTGFGEKKTVSAFKENDPVVTELFWKTLNHVLDTTQDMRETIGRVNRMTYCQTCHAFHLWYNPLNSDAPDPTDVSQKLAPAVLSLSSVRTS